MNGKTFKGNYRFCQIYVSTVPSMVSGNTEQLLLITQIMEGAAEIDMHNVFAMAPRQTIDTTQASHVVIQGKGVISLYLTIYYVCLS